jgi:hypothetical protein
MGTLDVLAFPRPLSIRPGNYKLITNSSATFERIGVNDIGRRCLLTDYIGVALGIGTTLDICHDEGRRCSSYELFKILQTGSASTSAFSLTTQEVISSRPVDLEESGDFKHL